ncbi:hypothetical protein BJF95_00875 [Rhizobium oryziradicis]|uniref:Uncharacterized protein n=2 Tax=Rhizobium oryziradicis TaxID=1867956 RepID=A0A1Q8ZLR5_9HYPH|nr:hypothetical protein BJF95_00875 [Rhizobium oryziradicis]
MNLAREFAMKRGGRAEAFLTHYLQGSGTDVTFSMKTLLDEDAGVRSKIFREINVQADARDAAKQPLKGMAGVIPVHQPEFQNQDWQYATGALNVEWEFVEEAVQRTIKVLKVKVWTTNLYRWHPEAQRFTQCVHVAAQNLQNPKKEIRFTTPPTGFAGSVAGIGKPAELEVIDYKKAKDFRMISSRDIIAVPRTSKRKAPQEMS